jgi:hypothetical protein
MKIVHQDTRVWTEIQTGYFPNTRQKKRYRLNSRAVFRCVQGVWLKRGEDDHNEIIICVLVYSTTLCQILSCANSMRNVSSLMTKPVKGMHRYLYALSKKTTDYRVIEKSPFLAHVLFAII